MCAVCCVDSSIFILVFHCIHIRGQRRRRRCPALARHIANCRCTLRSFLFLLSSHASFGFSIHTFFKPRQPPCKNTWLKILRRRRDASLPASDVGFVVFLWPHALSLALHAQWRARLLPAFKCKRVAVAVEVNVAVAVGVTPTLLLSSLLPRVPVHTHVTSLYRNLFCVCFCLLLLLLLLLLFSLRDKIKTK